MLINELFITDIKLINKLLCHGYNALYRLTFKDYQR